MTLRREFFWTDFIESKAVYLLNLKIIVLLSRNETKILEEIHSLLCIALYFRSLQGFLISPQNVFELLSICLIYVAQLYKKTFEA